MFGTENNHRQIKLILALPVLIGLGLAFSLPALVNAQRAVNINRAEPRTSASAVTAPAAGILVETDADNTSADGKCSLREAIINANRDTDLSSGDCESGSGGDTITFDNDYTITLASALPLITDTLAINGNGPENTIVQASTCNPVTLPGGCTPADWRVFTITGTTSILKELTVRYGTCDDGGGCLIDDDEGANIYSGYTNLTLDKVRVQSGFSDSNGGGILSRYGDLTIQNKSLIGGADSGNQSNDGYGGGIDFRYGSLVVDDSRIAYNYAENYGGGIHFQDGVSVTIKNGSQIDHNTSIESGGGLNAEGPNCQLTVDSSTFSDNTSGDDGGGLSTRCHTSISNSAINGNRSIDRDGGGIYAGSSSNLAVKHSTIYSNTASNGGAIYSSIIITVTNSTLSGNSALSGNGGGIYNKGTASLFNSTVSASSAEIGGGIYDIGTAMTLKNTILANSLAGEDCYTSAPLAADVNNIIENNNGCGTPISTDDPKLGPLADNGGQTLTHALQPGSPAIDSGDEATCAAAPVDGQDQRGVARPQGLKCDIGAFELRDFSLSVNLEGSGSGLVSSSPAGISCGADCSEIYPEGTPVTLTAEADAGSAFYGWSGACSGLGECVLEMDADKSATARFEPDLRVYLPVVFK